MLKAQELRIGNYVHLDSLTDGTSIDLECKLFHLEEINRSLKYIYSPIEITEEWLLKFGFTKEVMGFKHWNLDLYFHLDGEFFESDQLPMFIFIKYVHQLQNIYFALTGSELQVNVA